MDKLPPLLVAILASPVLLAQSGTERSESTPKPVVPADERAEDEKQGGQRASRQDQPVRVVVTASGFREEELSAPYAVDTLDQRTMIENGSRTLPEALHYTPGIMVQKTAHGHGSPYIRGFTGRQNLIMIDGIRFNNSIFRGGPVQYWNTIDAFSISELEIVKSQGSVLFGSDAVGGTVNVMTKSADFRGEASDRFFHHGTALYRFETNSQSHTGRLEASVGEGGRFGLHLGATYRDFGDIRDRELDLMPYTGYDEFDYDGRLDIGLTETMTLTFAHQRVTQDDIWRTHRTIYFEPWHGTSLSGPDLARIYDQDRSLTYLRLRDEDLGGFVDAWTLTFSYQHFEEDFLRSRTSGGNLRDEYDETRVDTYGAALALESDTGCGKLVWGFDYYQDGVDSSRRDVRRDPGTLAIVSDTMALQGPVGDDARYDLLGIYAQHRAPIGDDFELTFGGRYTYAAANIDVLDDGAGNPISADKNWDQLTFNLRGTYRLTADLALYGGASQAFRAPNVDDLSALKSSRTNEISTGSLDIDPENFLTYEVGTHYRGSDVAIDASVFYTDMKDLITSRPIGTVAGTGEIITASTNGADGYIWGIELEGSWRIDESWSTNGFVAYNDGRADMFPSNSLTSVREPVSRLMPVTGSVALRWQRPENPFWCGARVTAASRQDRLNAGDRSDTSRFPPDGTPGYVVLLLNGGYQVNEHVDLFLTIDNVTDTVYRVHGSGVNEPGINAILGGQLSW
ncbi:MAG: TonB-dependent receptor [Planctomycetes bacterium]|nr:TonB-dependent receptor [Planctomycetota bacterium]